MSKLVQYIIILFCILKASSCATLFKVSDIISQIDKYMDTHPIKNYYVTIDPNNLLDDIDHKLLEKYQNIIFEKYGLVTMVIVAKAFESYGYGLQPFIIQFFNQFKKVFDLQRLNCIISVISINDHRIGLDVSNRMRHIYTDNVLNALHDNMKITFNQNHLFLTIYNLLKNIEKGQKQYEEKGIITEL